MIARRKKGFLAFLAVIGALLIILPSAMLYMNVPLGGYEPVVEDHIARMSPEMRKYYYGPYPPVDAGMSTGVTISDMAAEAAQGNITSLEFTVGVSNGFPPLDLCSTSLVVSGESIWASNYGFYLDRNLSFSVLKDPDGLLARRLLSQNASIRVRITNVEADIEDRNIWLAFYPGYGRHKAFQFILPPFLTDPPLSLGTAGPIALVDTDGSYPKPPADDLIIRDYTLMENKTLSLDHNLTVLKNGILELRNSTIFLNMSTGGILEGRHLFTLNYSFNASEQFGPFIDALNEGFKANNISYKGYAYNLHGLWGDFWEITDWSGGYLLEMHPGAVDVYRDFDKNEWFSRGLYVGAGGTLRILASTVHIGDLPPPAMMAHQPPGGNIDFEIYGSALMERSRLIELPDAKGAAMDVRSSDVLLKNNTFYIPVHCYGCSPEIINNSFSNPDGAGLDLDNSSALVAGNTFKGSGGITMHALSNPQIIENRFFNEHAIGGGYCRPTILNNTMWNSTMAIDVYSSSAEIAGNTILDAQSGISVGWVSKANIHDNYISASDPVNVRDFSSADLSNNTIRDYDHYGVYSDDAAISLSGNTFLPGGNGINETMAAVQKWDLDIGLKKESAAQREYISPVFKLVSSGPLNQGKEVEISTGEGYAHTHVTEFQITDQGERMNVSGYRLSFDYQWWHYEIDVDANHIQMYTIVLRENAHDSSQMLSLIVLGILSMSMAAFPALGPRYLGWQSRREALLSRPLPEPGLPPELRRKLWRRIISLLLSIPAVMFISMVLLFALGRSMVPVLLVFWMIGMLTYTILMSTYVISVWQEGAEFLGTTTELYVNYKAALRDLNRIWRSTLVPLSVVTSALIGAFFALSLIISDGFFKFYWLLPLAIFINAAALGYKRKTLMDLSYRMYGFDPKKGLNVMIWLFVAMGAAALAVSIGYYFH